MVDQVQRLVSQELPSLVAEVVVGISPPLVIKVLVGLVVVETQKMVQLERKQVE
jgi:hypothetical protein